VAITLLGVFHILFSIPNFLFARECRDRQSSMLSFRG
jgi:hypothetical protein